MRTVILDQPGSFRLAETPEPARPGPGEALIEVKRVGVCGTDLHAFAGRQPFFTYPRILGHELGAVVVETGPDVASPRAGDRVAVEPYLACGHCIACRAGRYNCCATLRVLGVHVDGGMRERLVVPARLLHRSDRLSLEQLALVETLGIGAHAVERSALQPSEWAVVVGVGPIGIGVLQMTLARQARVIAVDLSPPPRLRRRPRRDGDGERARTRCRRGDRRPHGRGHGGMRLRRHGQPGQHGTFGRTAR